MLRRILITLGLVVAILPYLGFPYAWQMGISTTTGLLIVTILLFSRRPRRTEHLREEGRSLHVERMEVVERPELHVDREVVTETRETVESNGNEMVVQQEVTVFRRKRKPRVRPESTSEFPPETPPEVPRAD